MSSVFTGRHEAPLLLQFQPIAAAIEIQNTVTILGNSKVIPKVTSDDYNGVGMAWAG